MRLERNSLGNLHTVPPKLAAPKCTFCWVARSSQCDGGTCGSSTERPQISCPGVVCQSEVFCSCRVNERYGVADEIQSNDFCCGCPCVWRAWACHHRRCTRRTR